MQSIAADARVHCASLSRDEMIDVELTNEFMDEIVQGNSNTGTNAADFFRFAAPAVQDHECVDCVHNGP